MKQKIVNIKLVIFCLFIIFGYLPLKNICADTNNTISSVKTNNFIAEQITDFHFEENEISKQNSKEDFVNVKDFGAIGDGTTPDNKAIQAAIAHAYEAKIGAVLLPSGTYLLRKAVKLEATSIKHFGMGDTSILKCGVLTDHQDLHDNCVIYIRGNNIQLNSFAINGNRATGTWKQGDRIWDYTPKAGGYIGWVCTEGGIPGVWKGFGKIED